MGDLALFRLSGLGNVLFSLGIAHAWKERFPKGKVYLFTHWRYSSLLQHSPCVHQVIPLYRLSRKRRELRGDLWLHHLASALSFLRSRPFDVLCDLQGFSETLFLSWMTKASLKLGYLRRPHHRHLFHHSLLGRERSEGEHQLHQFLRLFCKGGIQLPWCPPHLQLPPPSSSFSLPRRLVIHIGASSPDKSYPIPLWQQVFQLLRRAEIPFCAFLGPSEAPLRQWLRDQSIPYFYSEDLLLSAQFLQSCSLFLGVDSGPLHLAALLGVPLVGLFPAQKLPRYAPLSTATVELLSASQLEEISPEEIVSKIRSK